MNVPVYVFGDTGTAGISLHFTYDKALTLNDFLMDPDNLAYVMTTSSAPQLYPANYVAISGNGANQTAPDGSTILMLNFTIPQDAQAGKTYSVDFHRGGTGREALEVCDSGGMTLNVSYFDGSITVIGDESPAINYENYLLGDEGEQVKLTVFNDPETITWSSSDESVATVSENGFVTAAAAGSCVITATDASGRTFECKITVGLFGDTDGNGEINIDDATFTLLIYTYEALGLDPGLTPEEYAIHDVTGDGVVTIDDATAILLYYTGQSVTGDPVTWFEATGNPNAPDAP